MTHRATRIAWLLTEVFLGRPEDIERPGSFTRRIATPVAMPMIAGGMFGASLTLALEQVMRARLGSQPLPADQLIELVSRLRLFATWGGMVVAVLATYLLATANFAVTATVWRILTLVSAGGRVPAWRWFVSRASSTCAYLSLFVVATGVFAPWLFSRTATPPPLDAIVGEHPVLVLTLAILMVLLHQLRSRNIAVVDHDI